MIYLLYIVLLVIAALVFKVLASLCHQLGHAIPALLWGIGNVGVFLGDENNPENCKRWRWGRLLVYWKPDRLWVEGGVTKCDFAALGYWQQIVVLAGGHLVILVLLLLSALIFLTLKPTNFWAILNAVGLSVLLVELLSPTMKAKPSAETGQANATDFEKINRLLRLSTEERLLQQAQMWALRKEFSKAAAALLPWLQRGDAPAKIYDWTIYYHSQAGEHLLAVAAKQAGIQRFGANADDFVALATLQVAAEQRQAAYQSLEKALRLSPRHVNALNNYGYYLSMEGELTPALAYLEQALSINPKMAYAHNNLGYVKIKQGLLEEGRQHVFRSLELDPQHVGAFYTLAVYHQALGEHKEAIAHLELAHALHPEFELYREALAEALHLAAKPESD